SVATETTSKFRYRFGYGFGGAGFSQHHVQGSAATAAICLVVVVDQVLVVGVGVNRFNVTVNDAITLVDQFQYWRDGVGGARSGSNDAVAWLDHVVVDTTDDVFQTAFAGCGQDYLGDAVGL